MFDETKIKLLTCVSTFYIQKCKFYYSFILNKIERIIFRRKKKYLKAVSLKYYTWNELKYKLSLSYL